MTAAPLGGSPAAASRSREVEPVAYRMRQGLFWSYLTSATRHQLRELRDSGFVVEPLYTHPQLYRCEGCDRETTDPEADLKSLKDAGKISCCPERKMKPIVDLPAAAAEAPGAERVINILEDAGVPEEWRPHYANLLAEALTPPPPVSVEEMVGRLRKYDELGPLPNLHIHPETPGYTTGQLWADARDARALLTALAEENGRLTKGLADGNDLLAKVSAALAEQEEENERLREALREARETLALFERHEEPDSEIAILSAQTLAKIDAALRSLTPREGG